MWAAFCRNPLASCTSRRRFCPERRDSKRHDLAWTCFDFFVLSCTFLFLSFSHYKDIPDCCSGSPTPSSSSSIYFSISPGAAGSCASIDSVGINKRLLLSDLKKTTEICILYDAVSLFSHSTCCMFMILNWIIVEKDDHVFFYFCHSYIFSFFYNDCFFLCILLIWSSINWGAMYYFWHFSLLAETRFLTITPPKVEPHVASWSRATFHSTQNTLPRPLSVILARCTCSEPLF